MSTFEQAASPVAPAAKRPRRRPSRRVVLIGSLAAAVVLVPAADVVARQVAERAVAGGMQDQFASAERPDVSLGGTPFIPQLFTRELSSVTFDVVGATACKVRMDRMHAELTGVKRSGDGVQAKTVKGDVLLRYDDLNASIAPLQLSGSGDGRVAIAAGGSFLGARASGLPRIESGHLVIEPEGLTATLGGATVIDGNLGALPEIRIPLRDVPTNLNLRLTPNADGLALAFDGTDVRVDDTGGTCRS
ncbi:MAG: LmeA family phospholipid-binding protein [Sporichthyaceae bacterium]